MSTFAEKPVCYKVGLFLLFLATTVFSVCLVVPWWAQTYNMNRREVTSHHGLWMGCRSENVSLPEKCTPIAAPGWFKAVQGLHCIALGWMVLACGYAVLSSCCLRHVTYSRTVEVCAGIGGMVGFVGAMVYVQKTSPVLKVDRAVSYSWAFGADVASCIVVVIIAGVIGVSNVREDGDDRSLILEEIHHEDLTPVHRHRLVGVSSTQLDREEEAATSTTSSPRPARSAGPNTEVFVVQTNFPSVPDNVSRTNADICKGLRDKRCQISTCGAQPNQGCSHQPQTSANEDATHSEKVSGVAVSPDTHKTPCQNHKSVCGSSCCSGDCGKKSQKSSNAGQASSNAFLPPYSHLDQPKGASLSACHQQNAPTPGCHLGCPEKPTIESPAPGDDSPPSYRTMDVYNNPYCSCCNARSGATRAQGESLAAYQLHEEGVASTKPTSRLEASAPPPDYTHADFATAQYTANNDAAILARDGLRREQ